MQSITNYFTAFRASTASYQLPERFTFPFYYEPHPIAILATQELQEHLQTQQNWKHNFGLDPAQDISSSIGKMFGVLVVQNQAGELGYLAAFSGKLAEANHHPGFVPPIFDMLEADSFFNKGMPILNAMNARIKQLEQQPELAQAHQFLNTEKTEAEQEITTHKQTIKTNKKARKARRQTEEPQLSPEQYAILKEELRQQSLREQYFLKDLNRRWEARLQHAQQQLDQYLEEINQLKQQRKEMSSDLQQQLFDQYHFLNQAGTPKSLCSIFEKTIYQTPPAGAGECAAPKLLQYAFQNQLKPIVMAEFWWGQSPKSEIRKHKQYYPACKGKCQPILAHMLAGMELDENPMLKNPALGKTLETIFEDEHFLVVNKPAEFFSVPGRTIQDSVYWRIKQRYPKATGPLIVHRLDMSTSGIMLIAKTKDVHKRLQYQFIKRIVKKRYVAVLEGIVEADEGTIDLPLCGDFNDRPRQMVSQEQGKAARTHWKVLERTATQTRIQFFPITGRTHQLRVHAAHTLGLNCPILGDDLYGNKGERLHLHAEAIQLLHPVSKEVIQFEVPPKF